MYVHYIMYVHQDSRNKTAYPVDYFLFLQTSHLQSFHELYPLVEGMVLEFVDTVGQDHTPPSKELWTEEQPSKHQVRDPVQFNSIHTQKRTSTFTFVFVTDHDQLCKDSNHSLAARFHVPTIHLCACRPVWHCVCVFGGVLRSTVYIHVTLYSKNSPLPLRTHRNLFYYLVFY